MEFSIDVTTNATAQYYSVMVAGHDYETDSYNPWIRNIKFDAVGEAIAFKNELDTIEWDDDDQYSLGNNKHPPLMTKYLGGGWAYLHRMMDGYQIFAVKAKCLLLTDNDLRKHLIDDVLKEL